MFDVATLKTEQLFVNHDKTVDTLSSRKVSLKHDNIDWQLINIK